MNTHFRLSIAMFFLMLFPLIGPAQSIGDLDESIDAMPPGVGSLIDQIDANTNLNTGSFNYSIPLGQVSGRIISVPISLSYNGSGIQVAATASDVGQNWALNAGGMVMRTVKDMPDERPGGWMNYDSNITVEQSFESIWLTCPGDTWTRSEAEAMNLMAVSPVDTEADIFSFNFNGYSGKFFFDKAKDKIILIEGQNIKIEVDLANENSVGGCNIRRFTITTGDGTKYYFGSPSSTEESCETVKAEFIEAYNKPFSYPVGWHLVEIKSFDGSETINFNYTQEKYAYGFRSPCSQLGSPLAGPSSTTISCGGIGGSNYSYNKVETYRLTSIVSSIQTASFISYSVREDLLDYDDPEVVNTTAKAVDRITISDVSGICQSFDLDFDYFVDNSSYADGSPNDKRLALMSVQMGSCASSIFSPVAFDPYVFEYYGWPFLPNRLTRAVDHWGYYNGADSNNDFNYQTHLNIPRLTRVEDFAGITNFNWVSNDPPSITWPFINWQSIQYYPINPIPAPNQDCHLFEFTATYAGTPGNAIRESDSESQKIGVLERVTTPSGSISEFVVEANTHYDEIEFVEVTNIINAETYCNDISPGQCDCSDILWQSQRFVIDETNVDELFLISTHIPEVTSSGSSCNINVHSFKLIAYEPGTTSPVLDSYEISSNVTPSESLPNGSPLSDISGLLLGKEYEIEARVSNGTVRAIINQVETWTENGNKPVGGVRLKEKRTYESQGEVPLVVSYDYNQLDGRSSGELIAEPRYRYLHPFSLGFGYSSNANTPYVTPANYFESSISPLTSYTGSHINYERVTTIYAGLGHEVAIFSRYGPVYPGPINIGQETLEKAAYPAETLPYNPAAGQLQHKTLYAEGGTEPLRQESYSYTGGQLFQSDLNIAFSGWGPGSYNDYRITFGMPSLLECQTVTLDGVAQATNYEYDGLDPLDDWPSSNVHYSELKLHYNPTATIVSGAGIPEQRTEIDYAYDLNHQDMIGKYRVNIPIKQLTLAGGQLIGGTRVKFNANCYPKKYFKIYADGSERLLATLKQLNSRGRPRLIEREGFHNQNINYDNGNEFNIKQIQQSNWEKDITYYGSNNSSLVEQIEDIDGQYIDYEYDGIGRLTRIEARNGGIVTEYIYSTGNGNNKITTITNFAALGVTPATTVTEIKSFDNLNRHTETTVNGVVKESKQYNTIGQLFRTLASPLVWVDYTYEPSILHRPTAMINADGSTVQYMYGEEEGLFKKTTIDEVDNSSYVLTDVMNRQHAYIDAHGNRTSHSYAANGQIGGIQPPIGEAYSYSYHPVTQLLVAKTIPGGGTTSYEYDELDRLAYTITAKGDRINLAYDGYGRQVGSSKGASFTDTAIPPHGYTVSSLPGDILSIDTYGGAGSQNIETGKIISQQVSLLNPGSGNVVTDFSFDEFGRVSETVETATIDGNQITTLTYPTLDHRDLPYVIKTALDFGNDAFNQQTEMNYDNFGRMISNKVNASGSGWAQEFKVPVLQYDDADRVTSKMFWRGSSGAWYGERYEYNSRGWLTRINTPEERSFDLEDHCMLPDESVYNATLVEENLPFSEIIDLIASGADITIVGFNPCPDGPDNPGEDPDNTGDDGDCFVALSDYRVDFGLQVPAGVLPSCGKSCQKSSLIPLNKSFTINAISGYDPDGNLVDLPLGQNFTFVNWDNTSPFPVPTIDDAAIQAFETTVANILADYDYLIEKVEVQINPSLIGQSNYFFINFIQSNFAFDSVSGSVDYRLGCYDGSSVEKACGDTYTHAILTKSIKSNTNNIPCKGMPTPIGSNPGGNQTVTKLIADADAEIMSYPLVFYGLTTKTKSDEFETDQKLFLTASELALLENKYEVDQLYKVNSAAQIFEVTTDNAVLENKQFNEIINYRKSPSIAIEVLDLKGRIDIDPISGNNGDCDFYENPVCTDDDARDQLAVIEEIYNTWLPNLENIHAINYPMSLNYIMLCDGTRVLIPSDFLLNLIPGNYHILDTEIINSPDDRLDVIYRIPDQLFSLDLDYLKNGNIERATWKNTYQSPQYYDYTYDALNRIESATYGVIDGGVPDPSALLDGAYNVSNITYDAIGNILSLDRTAYIDPTTGIGDIDKLTYLYSDQLSFGEAATPGDTYPVSQLLAVSDQVNGDPASLGFSQGAVTNGENGDTQTYGYDGAGNMLSDPYKGLAIVYNHLNLPEKIGDTDVTYDASGRKWHQSNTTEDLIYVGGFLFRDGEFVSLQIGDGRIFYNEDQDDYYSEYHHKDHLGNVRVAFVDYNDNGRIDLADPTAGEVTQINTYYPFGMIHPENCVPGGVTGNDNRYRYNSKELLEDYGLYDYGARYYDPAIGRWGGVDPLAEGFARWSTYNYVLGNPVRLVDKDGRAPTFTGPGDKLTGDQVRSYFDSNKTPVSYSISIYSNQPIPGTDEILDGTEFGHAFVGVSVSYSDNSTQTLFAGLYSTAEANVNPALGIYEGEGVIQDDSGSRATAEFTKEIDAEGFQNVIDFIASNADGVTYDINTNNCTDFAVTCFNEGGGTEINSKARELKGTHPFIGEYDFGTAKMPGQLGADIKSAGGTSGSSTYIPGDGDAGEEDSKSWKD